MSYVFISYAHEDGDFVERLIESLRKANIKDVWFDKAGLKPNISDWDDAIRKAIEGSEAVLFVASPDSRKSLYVRDELQIASEKKKSIYSVWARGTTYLDCVPIGLGSKQYIDLRGDAYPNGLEQLITALNDLKGSSSQFAQVDTPKTPICFRCKCPIINWAGVVMVDLPAFVDQPVSKIPWLRPYCSPCVKELDEYENGKERMHHIWMLRSVRDTPLLYLAEVLRDIVSSDQLNKWYPQAISDLVNLIILALPNQQALDMLQGFSDWNLEGPLAKELLIRIDHQEDRKPANEEETVLNHNLKEPSYDKILLWFDENAEAIFSRSLPSKFIGEVESKDRNSRWHGRGDIISANLFTKQWQYTIKSENDFIRFIDIHCKMECHVNLYEDYQIYKNYGTSSNKISTAIGYLDCYIIVRTSIDSIGELIREISTYKHYIQRPFQFYVVSPDSRYADILESQDIKFIKYEY